VKDELTKAKRELEEYKAKTGFINEAKMM